MDSVIDACIHRASTKISNRTIYLMRYCLINCALLGGSRVIILGRHTIIK